MSLPSLAQRLALRERPARRVAMLQRWDALAFVHWEIEPARIQATLPPGLRVDTFDGRAFVGVVPFFMNRVHPAGLPCVPWISDFLELNVRTYVHDERGRPGVWFYSLDCNQPVAIWAARHFFGLPYFRARMSATRGVDGTISYSSTRCDSEAAAAFTYSYEGEAFPAQPGSLEFFLIERYLLYSWKRTGLFSGQVHHPPYSLKSIALPRAKQSFITGLGFADAECAPVHIIGCEGLAVEIFPLERVAG